MKRKLLFVNTLCLVTTFLHAQQRYLDEIFSTVNVTKDVKYGENYSVLTGSPVLEDLFMDVYEPQGDTASARPLIIMAHAGSFLPKGTNTLPLGDKEDSCMIEMCTQFAKRGWVAASIDYRLGWNPTSSDADVRAGTIMNAVYRAMQDMKACVRFFKLNEATYKIDTMRITVGGSNSGGYMAVTYTSLNDTNELKLLKFRHSVTGDPYINQAVTGGFDGEGGAAGVNNYSNPGPTSTVQLALNLGGAIGDTSWQEAGEAPIINFHGEEDALTPYKTAVVIVAATMQSVVEVSGSHDLARYATTLNNQVLHDEFFTDPYTQVANSRTNHKGLFPFPGAANGFEPWGWYDPSDPNAVNAGGSAANPGANPAKGRLYIDTIMNYFCPRAVQVLGLPGNTVGIQENSSAEKISVYPNPAKENLLIRSTSPIQMVELIDITGQVIRRQEVIHTVNFTVEREDLTAGIYFVNVSLENGQRFTRKVIFN
jgi:dienelactone hydrolase